MGRHEATTDMDHQTAGMVRDSRLRSTKKATSNRPKDLAESDKIRKSQKK